MTLYEINTAIQDCLLIDDETGEVIGIDEAALNDLQMERDQKIENIALWIKNLTADAKAIREEEKTLADRRQRMERKADRLQTFLSEYLDGEKFSTSRCAVSWRTVKTLSVENTTALTEWLEQQPCGGNYLRYKEPEIDKAAVKRAVQEGIEMPGCSIAEKKSMSIK